MKPVHLSAKPATNAAPADDEVDRRSKMAIAIFVSASLCAGLVYAGKQFASREIVLTASHGQPAAAASALAPQRVTGAARPEAGMPRATERKETDGNVVDKTH